MLRVTAISLSLKKYYGKDIDENNVKDIKEIAGHGASAAVDGKRSSPAI